MEIQAAIEGAVKAVEGEAKKIEGEVVAEAKKVEAAVEKVVERVTQALTADEKLAQERHDHPIPPDEEHCLSREEDAADKKEIKPFDYYEIGTLIIVVILIILFSGSIIWHSIPPFDIKHLLFTHQ